jgi:hypothetical protein
VNNTGESKKAKANLKKSKSDVGSNSSTETYDSYKTI